MMPLNNRKILIHFLVIIIVVTMYDVMLHSLLTIVHLAFEWFELALEHLIEHLFHTDRKQGQIIVFYLLCFMALGGCYLLWRVLPVFYHWLKNRLLAIGREYQLYLASYWEQLSSAQKIKCVTSFTMSVSFLALVVFS
ncbi:hypothetical protein [Methylobacter psychrophilus]|uniref:hypothetical protein n=1 Tax=Methylobacter psychrophilus TaxID=96941 RepID=UPI0021D50964|nr:hypothetical protein [Methylobacter psychrophilus]